MDSSTATGTSVPQLTFTFTPVGPIEREESTKFNHVLYKTTVLARHNYSLANNDILSDDYHITEQYRKVVEPIIAEANPYDIISVQVENEHLQKNQLPWNINVSYMAKRHFRYTDFAEKIFATAQSNKHFMLDGKLTITVIIVKSLRGGRRSNKRIVTKGQRRRSKSSIIEINNDDHRCGFYAIAMGKWLVDNPLGRSQSSSRNKYWRRLRDDARTGKRKCLRTLTSHMSRDYDINMDQELDLNGLETLQNKFEKDFQIIVYEDGADRKPHAVFKGKSKAKKKVLLDYYTTSEGGHYSLITSITGYTGSKHFCFGCSRGYENRYKHSCEHTCYKCRSDSNCPTESIDIVCDECGTVFNSELCYKNHLQTICKDKKKCSLCEVQYSTQQPHDCGKYYCLKCGQFYTATPHYCCIKPLNLKNLAKADERTKISVYFDIESYAKKVEGDKSVQVPNLLICHVVCDKCWDWKDKIKKDLECPTCGLLEHKYQGEGCVTKFCDFIFNSLSKKANVVKADVHVYAHNFQGYDGHFVMQDIFDRDIPDPQLVMIGCKVLRILLGNVRFQDSLSYFQQGLSGLPKSFGFEDRVTKGYFIHSWNKPELWNYEGPIPELDESLDDMSEVEVNKIKSWHAELVESNYIFNFQTELEKYCRADVEILKIAVQEFRRLLISINGFDSTTRKFTLASIALETYRANHLQPDMIGKTPIIPYSKSQQSSIHADTWLDMIERRDKIIILREQQIGPYRADGFCKERNIVYEFNGCRYHGCLKCYPRRDRPIFVNDKNSMPDKLRYKTAMKRHYYQRRGYKVVETWGCDFDRFLSTTTPEVEEVRQEIYKRNYIEHSINIRDSFYGGRTNNIYLNYECAHNEVICYDDFVSLYPWVQTTQKYPIGHPTIIRHSFKDISTYFGFAKVNILPPKKLFIPVLPQRHGDKLVFALCNKCAAEQLENCSHNENERSITGTWTTVELEKAIEVGYKIQEIYEVLHYESTTTHMFDGYIRHWLKLKIESSGFPPGIMTKEQRVQYIRFVKEKENIDLDEDSIRINKGMRLIAKLMLNSLWGKLAEKPNKEKTSICSDQGKVQQLHKDWLVTRYSQIKSTSGKEKVFLTYKKQDDEDCVPGDTSVAIASFVTSYGRLKLYELMQELQRRGHKILYFDTDSVIYVRKLTEEPLPKGSCLGELTDEILDYTGDPAAKAIAFSARGPKDYTIHIRMPDGSEKILDKRKGIRINHSTEEILTGFALMEMAQARLVGQQQTLSVKQFQMRTDLTTQQPYSCHFNKNIQVTSDKRMLALDNQELIDYRGGPQPTLPYGFTLN